MTLQRTKNEYLNTNDTPKLRHPYYWAGFVVYGDDSAIISASLSPYWYLLFLGLAVVLIYVAIALKRRSIK